MQTFFNHFFPQEHYIFLTLHQCQYCRPIDKTPFSKPHLCSCPLLLPHPYWFFFLSSSLGSVQNPTDTIVFVSCCSCAFLPHKSVSHIPAVEYAGSRHDLRKLTRVIEEISTSQKVWVDYNFVIAARWCNAVERKVPKAHRYTHQLPVH